MSSIKSLKALEREIKTGKTAAVYVIIGDETWSKEKFVALLKTALIDPSLADFNYEQFNAGDIKAIAVVDKAGELPMMADARLILVQNCQDWNAKDLDALTGYMNQPNPTTCLVLEFPSADRRRKLFSFKTASIRYIEFPRPKPWELEDYIRDLVANLGLRLTAEAVTQVADLAGDDLSKVHRELDKLSLYKMGAEQIDADDVAALLGRTRQVTRWELNEFIGSRDLGGALVKAGDILGSGEETGGLLAAINLYLKQLFMVKALMRKGIRESARVGQVVGVPPRIAERLIQAQAQFSDYELRQSLDLVKEADNQMKSAASLDKRLVVDRLLARLLPRGSFSPPQPRASKRR